jgi:hypothetical protein
MFLLEYANGTRSMMYARCDYNTAALVPKLPGFDHRMCVPSFVLVMCFALAKEKPVDTPLTFAPLRPFNFNWSQVLRER